MLMKTQCTRFLAAIVTTITLLFYREQAVCPTFSFCLDRGGSREGCRHTEGWWDRKYSGCHLNTSSLSATVTTAAYLFFSVEKVESRFGFLPPQQQSEKFFFSPKPGVSSATLCINSTRDIVRNSWNMFQEQKHQYLFLNFALLSLDSLLLPLSSDPAAGWHPASGGLIGPPDDRCSPQRLRSFEEPGVWKSQRRQQDRPEELRRHTSSGPTAPEDHRCGDPRTPHR